jgi:transcription elongation factor SPT6
LYFGAQQVREGFIVEDEEAEEEEGEESDGGERHAKRKRAHRDRVEDELLDEDDLELIGEQMPDWNRRQTTEVCYHQASAHIRSSVTDTKATEAKVQTIEARSPG